MTTTPRAETLQVLADTFATLIAECLMPPEHLDRLTHPSGLALGTECTVWFVPTLGQVVVWDMVSDPEMVRPIRSLTSPTVL